MSRTKHYKSCRAYEWPVVQRPENCPVCRYVERIIDDVKNMIVNDLTLKPTPVNPDDYAYVDGYNDCLEDVIDMLKAYTGK